MSYKTSFRPAKPGFTALMQCNAACAQCMAFVLGIHHVDDYGPAPKPPDYTQV
jgi:hypothetical protein